MMRKGLRAMLAWMLVALLAFGALAEGEQTGGGTDGWVDVSGGGVSTGSSIIGTASSAGSAGSSWGFSKFSKYS